METCECVYEPAEDTELTIEAAHVLARLTDELGVAVDLGTGTGVVAAWLYRLGAQRVVAVDVSPLAVACARRNLPPDVAVVECSGASCLGWFDTAVANLPYLPVDVEEDGCGGWLSLSWAAGRRGERALGLCLEAARAARGVAVVYSTLTPFNVEECLAREGFRVAWRRVKPGFFEKMVAVVGVRATVPAETRSGGSRGSGQPRLPRQAG